MHKPKKFTILCLIMVNCCLCLQLPLSHHNIQPANCSLPRHSYYVRGNQLWHGNIHGSWCLSKR